MRRTFWLAAGFGLGLYAEFRRDPERFRGGYDDLLGATSGRWHLVGSPAHREARRREPGRVIERFGGEAGNREDRHVHRRATLQADAEQVMGADQ